MSAILKSPMNVEEFLAWAEAQEGRYELEGGAVVAMAPERLAHVEAKGEVFASLREALRRADLGCRVLTDGATVRVDHQTAYEPDALVYCGPRLPGNELECPNPIIIVEVLSPSTSYRDLNVKLSGYFAIPSVQHYLVVDADRRVVLHHRRAEEGATIVRILGEGDLVLDPPGLTVAVTAMLPPVQA